MSRYAYLTLLAKFRVTLRLRVWSGPPENFQPALPFLYKRLKTLTE